MAKTLTIIIPTYNRATLLQRLLKQLLQQTQPPEEIIVVDDHSDDNTAALVADLQRRAPRVRYSLNRGQHLAAARKTGLRLAESEYVSFIDDDVIIDDTDFLAKLEPLLRPDTMIQPKVIMENLRQRDISSLTFSDILATRPWPILEVVTARLNRGSLPRPVYPFNELGVFWHRQLNSYWHDPHLIGDAYGQSYSSAARLIRDGFKIIHCPHLVLRHPGAPSGGSKKFAKKLMTEDFTPFHFDYFYNMVYLNSRFFPRWIWLWLSYYVGKSLVALAFNRNLKGWQEYAIKPIFKSFRAHFLTHPLKNNYKLQTTNYKFFIWQGHWHGGAERVTLSAATYFAQRGLHVTLGVYKEDSNIALSQIVFPHVTLVPPSFRALTASLLFRFRHARHFSAVYAHTLGAWKTRSNKLFIHEAADLDAKLHHTTGIARRITYRLWRWLYHQLNLNRATAIFAATPECAAYLSRRGVPSQRIIASSSFYDSTIFRLVTRPLPTEIVKIIFVGNYSDPVKNFASVRQHFYQSPRFTVTVAGGDKRPPDANISFLGYLLPGRLFAALAAAHIFFMPSLSEGFSIALLEALATGLPCLVNRRAVPTPLLGTANLIPYDSDTEIQPRINEIINNYRRFIAPDPRLQSFAESHVLQKEYEAITKLYNLSF